jgi:beta-glucosidase
MDDARAIGAVHHLLLGHGLAVDALRASGTDAQLGIVLNVYPVEPATDADADADAARRIDGIANRIFLDPLLRGTYPDDVVADLAEVSDFSHVRDGDLEVISRPLDFLGENYYSPYVVRAPGAEEDEASRRAGDHTGGSTRTTRSPWPGARDVVFADRGRPRTQMGWEVEPAGLRRVLDRLVEYGAPALYVTENGAAYEDSVQDGAVHDVDRTGYVRDHLGVALQARADGLDVRGYFLWSFMDNFEWSWGYSRRFGAVHVDYDTQERTPKDSAHWYRDVTRTRRLQ